MNYISIDSQRNINLDGIKSYKFDNTTIHVDGLIYVYGKKAGKETVEWLFESIQRTGCIPYEELRGAYTCIIQEKDKITAFTDNSNMHCLYYSDSMICNSFLKIVKYESETGTIPYFDLEAICEYLTIGNVFFDKTFFANIYILPSTKIAMIEQNKISIIQKPIGDIDKPSHLKSINDYFEKVAFSLSEMKVCQALTGGYDSRIIYACLSNRIQDHPAISTSDPNNKEVKCAQKVAMANKENLEIISIKKPEFTEDLIDSLFEKKDGIVPLDIDTDIRLIAFKTTLAKLFNIHLSGDGGALHKDREWNQDLPFYRKKKSDSNQFYRQRLYYLRNDNHLGDKLKSTFDGQSQRFQNALDCIAKGINTQSYDSWYYRISKNLRTDYNCNPVEGIISYAPLLELDIVRFSYSLPRRKRFFFNSMRQTITKENKQVARVKTIYGTNASNEWPFVFADVFFQTFEYFRKAIRLIGRMVFNKNILNPGILDWSMEKELRNSDVAKKAISFTQQRGFIKSTLSMDSLSFSEVQRIVHIYWLFCFVSDCKRQEIQ